MLQCTHRQDKLLTITREFKNEAPSAHRMKSSFLFTLWGWAKVTKVDNLISLVGFLAWMGCR